MNARPILLTVFFFVLGGCATFTISPDELVKQLKENQSSNERFQILPGPTLFLGSKYPSNGIAVILCLNSKGEKIYLYPDKNTQLEITSKSTIEVVKMYWDTVFLVEGKLIGLRSRLIQTMTRQIAVEDIEKVEITAEFPKTRRLEEK